MIDTEVGSLTVGVKRKAMKKPSSNTLIHDICKKLRHDFDSWETIPTEKPQDEQKKERVKLYFEIKKRMEDLK